MRMGSRNRPSDKTIEGGRLQELRHKAWQRRASTRYVNLRNDDDHRS